MSRVSIRYKIDPEVRHLSLLKDDYVPEAPVEKIEVPFLYEHTYFLNIIDASTVDPHFVKMRIFMHDGSVVEGWQFLDFVQLHHVGNVFDGRFNV